jgi:hypothetical protein
MNRPDLDQYGQHLQSILECRFDFKTDIVGARRRTFAHPIRPDQCKKYVGALESLAYVFRKFGAWSNFSRIPKYGIKPVSRPEILANQSRYCLAVTAPIESRHPHKNCQVKRLPPKRSSQLF